MADGNISQITLPNGSTYEIKDEVARAIDLTATYTAGTFDLALSLDSAIDADDTEY